ncbi:MAG: DUF488 family protein [Deltaproteobacteria bacterium]|nr:DUF488 family protein [Deltaproteobacteria bacterium]
MDGGSPAKSWLKKSRTDFFSILSDESASDEKKAALKSLKDLVKTAKGRDVTLLCTCREEGRCHRKIVKEARKR